MASKIVPPFKVESDEIGYVITEGSGEAVIAVLWSQRYSEKMLATELCAVMNENSSRLCHAANGEEVCGGEKM